MLYSQFAVLLLFSSLFAFVDAFRYGPAATQFGRLASLTSSLPISKLTKGSCPVGDLSWRIQPLACTTSGESSVPVLEAEVVQITESSSSVSTAPPEQGNNNLTV